MIKISKTALSDMELPPVMMDEFNNIGFEEKVKEIEDELNRKSVSKRLDELEEELEGIIENLDEVPIEIAEKWLADLRLIKEEHLHETAKYLDSKGVTFKGFETMPLTGIFTGAPTTNLSKAGEVFASAKQSTAQKAMNKLLSSPKNLAKER